MLDIKLMRENPQRVKEDLSKRGFDFDLDRFVEIDEKRRKKIKEVDEMRARHNVLSEEVTKSNERERKIAESKELKTQLGHAEFELKALEEEFQEFMYSLPNIPLDEVPVGKDESGNQVIKVWGEPTKFDFKVRDHVEIGEHLGIIDIERAAKITGSRFNYLKGEAALLESALIQFVMDSLTSREAVSRIIKEANLSVSDSPFTPVIPPVMIRPDMFKKMGRLNPEDKDERYYLQQDDLYLIGSAEHTLGAMHADEVLDQDILPIRYVGFSTSFRREAGSYGKDTRGIMRMHQFDKLELESFSLPEQSYGEHLFFVAIQEYLTRSLKIPYRVILMSTGDMGKPNARQSDIEMWMPGQNMYRETHTADFMTDYQTRRLNTKVKLRSGNSIFAHSNDATAFAIGRTLIAILENYQKEDGSVKIPEVLQKYTGGIKEVHGQK